MFQHIQTTLGQVRRFDQVIQSTALEFGEMQTPSGVEFAVQANGQAAVLEPKGMAHLVGHWKLPPDHFSRLPRALQVAEITHFSRTEPKTLTLRKVEGVGAPIPTIRAALSGRYSPFDSSDVLAAAEPHIQGLEMARPTVTRDEMSVMLTRAQEYDVSHTRAKGDIVKVGLTIRNNELGEGSVGIDFGIWRLACLNGMQMFSPEVTIRQRHMYVDRRAFTAIVRNAVGNAREIGESMVEGLRRAHSLELPKLDPDGDGLQKAVIGVFRKHGVWTRDLQGHIRDRLGSQEEASLFGLVQVISGPWAKATDSLTVRHDRERIAGELLQLASA